MVVEPPRVLPKSFFERPTLEAAADTIGKLLVREIDGERRIGRIVEVEAYIGESDAASHARFGRTRRNTPMYGPAGHSYIYLIYGMYHCLNIVTEREGFPAALLIRALAPVEGVNGRTNGPGLVCRALSIDLSLQGHDMSLPPLSIMSDGYNPPSIAQSPRIGVGYAGEAANLPWRFVNPTSPFLSRRWHEI